MRLNHINKLCIIKKMVYNNNFEYIFKIIVGIK